MAAEPRVTVVTGASSGIGRAAAHEFARRGDRLVLVARSPAPLEEAATECRQLGAEVATIVLDLALPGAPAQVVDEVVRLHGRLDTWVGNASVFGYGTAVEMPEADAERIIRVNLLSQMAGVRAAAAVMLRQGAGSIVVVASLFARVPAPYVSAYVAAKHGLLGFTESVRLELHGTGVAVSSVLPATIDTPIYQRAANHTGHAVRPLPPRVDARRVARVIERRARRPRPVTTVGVVQGGGWPLSLLARPVYGAVIRAGQNRLGLRAEPAEPTSGNLYEPRGPEGVGGGWRG